MWRHLMTYFNTYFSFLIISNFNTIDRKHLTLIHVYECVCVPVCVCISVCLSVCSCLSLCGYLVSKSTFTRDIYMMSYIDSLF